MDRTVFANIPPIGCACFSIADLQAGLAGCVCTDEERILRFYSCGVITVPMTTAQRDWCIQEADHAGEGEHSRATLEPLSDKDLARTVLSAWVNYCRSQGLL